MTTDASSPTLEPTEDSESAVMLQVLGVAPAVLIEEEPSLKWSRVSRRDGDTPRGRAPRYNHPEVSEFGGGRHVIMASTSSISLDGYVPFLHRDILVFRTPEPNLDGLLIKS